MERSHPTHCRAYITSDKVSHIVVVSMTFERLREMLPQVICPTENAPEDAAPACDTEARKPLIYMAFRVSPEALGEAVREGGGASLSDVSMRASIYRGAASAVSQRPTRRRTACPTRPGAGLPLSDGLSHGLSYGLSHADLKLFMPFGPACRTTCGTARHTPCPTVCQLSDNVGQ